MWRVAGVGLPLLVGCNQIFGLAPARTRDAGPDVPPDIPRVVLTWQLATLSSSGVPEALDYPPFAPGFAPEVRVATLEGEFQPAEYLTSSGMEGWIQVPRDYFGTTWRLEYTLPGSVAHEVQWAPEDKRGHLTVPMVGRIAREPVPAGSGYTITPTDYSGSYMSPRVLTIGTWTEGPVTAPFMGPTGSIVDYDFASARSLSGNKGSPDPTKGDRGLLVDFASVPVDTQGQIRCQAAIGSASFDPMLQAGGHTLRDVTWDITQRSVSAPPVDLAFANRLTPLHGSLNASSSLLLYGAVASTEFPGLTSAPPAGIVLPIPVMQTLLRCPYNAPSLPSVGSPAILEAFPRVLHVQLVAIRSVPPPLSLSLNGGLETVVSSSTSGGFEIAFPAPTAKEITLTTPNNGMVDLAGASEQVAAGSPTGTFTLDFALETGAGLRADYHDVVLHQIAGGKLTPRRIFTVTAPTVRIDGSLFAPGDYVFEIRTYKGHPMASLGDFVPVDYPYGAAITFTRTFAISP